MWKRPVFFLSATLTGIGSAARSVQSSPACQDSAFDKRLQRGIGFRWAPSFSLFWRIIHMRTKSFLSVTLIFLVVAGSRCLQAQAPGTDRDMAPAASGHPSASVAPFGVALAPPIYFVNFMLLYLTNPETATYMPAYRVALPQEVYKCLFENPDGCPYAAMEPFFAEQAGDGENSRKPRTFWPSSCQTDPKFGILAPPEDRQPVQINEPLGSKKADRLATLLGIKPDMILTDEEYKCLIGAPPRDVAREIIYACSMDLTNSNGNTEIPLSSYGLYINLKRDVRSDCAPQAPCLEFNKLFAGPLEVIAKQCGFEKKLARLVAETPFLEFIKQGSACQQAWMPSCIAEAPCARNGDQSNNNKCAAPIAPQ
jgi:hypothetical protein